MGYPFSVGLRFICADKHQHALQKWLCLLATSFPGAEKGGKEAPRGKPLGTPGRRPAFFLGKPAGAPTPERKGIRRGEPRPPGTGLVINYSISPWDGGYLFLPCSIASKGPGCTHPGPFLRIWRGQEAASLSLSLSLLSRGRFSRPEDSSGSGSSGGGVTSICTRSIRLSSILRTVKVTFS